MFFVWWTICCSRFTGNIARLMLIKVKDIDLILIKFNKIGSEKCLECFCILLTDVRERMAKCTSEVCISAVHVKGDGDRDRMVVGFTTTYMQSVPISSLMLWFGISIRARCTSLCDKVCQWLATGQWFSPGPPVSSTNKTDRHDITEILLKVALNTITLTLSINGANLNTQLYRLRVILAALM